MKNTLIKFATWIFGFIYFFIFLRINWNKKQALASTVFEKSLSNENIFKKEAVHFWFSWKENS